jgi:hypothetical protein
MAKIRWNKYGRNLSEEQLAALEEEQNRLERYGTTTEEDLEATKAQQEAGYPSKSSAKLWIQPGLANDIERSQALAYYAKNDPGWDAMISKLTNEIAFSPYYSRTNATHKDATSLAQDAYLKMKGYRASKQALR